ncbi:hypothetical protein [Natrinema sp. SYSU A 869]|uniref:hypothetical protein n=1 Tax=Natrinema sp. SYSU A 869 TaxID=2871694 RepID=UPI002105A6EC|nr:hypothetical protein [Natrinema sp. SYSU A 869]
MTRLERQTVLGAVGTGALGAAAGCLDFEFLEADDSPQQFEADDLDSILSMDALNVARPAPVRPSEGAVDDAIDRLDELLESVPDPLEADDVSIDAVRREIDGTREIARDKHEAVAESSDRFHTMRRSIVARRFARQAAIAFDAVDDGPSGDKLESAFEDVATRVERQKTESEYLGTDPQRTLLLEYRRESELAAAGRWLERLESELDTAGRWLDDRSRDDTTVALSVGEIGGVIERARAALAFTTELERRHEARLDDDRSFETRFEDALDRSLAAIDAADIPGHSSGLVESVDADVSETVAERVLREGRFRLSKRVRGRGTKRRPAGRRPHFVRPARSSATDARSRRFVNGSKTALTELSRRSTTFARSANPRSRPRPTHRSHPTIRRWAAILSRTNANDSSGSMPRSEAWSMPLGRTCSTSMRSTSSSAHDSKRYPRRSPFSRIGSRRNHSGAIDASRSTSVRTVHTPTNRRTCSAFPPSIRLPSAALPPSSGRRRRGSCSASSVDTDTEMTSSGPKPVHPWPTGDGPTPCSGGTRPPTRHSHVRADPIVRTRSQYP